MKGVPFGDIKKICENKALQSRKNLHKKFGHGRDSNPSFCLADLAKSFKNLEAEEATLLWQLVEGSL